MSLWFVQFSLRLPCILLGGCLSILLFVQRWHALSLIILFLYVSIYELQDYWTIKKFSGWIGYRDYYVVDSSFIYLSASSSALFILICFLLANPFFQLYLHATISRGMECYVIHYSLNHPLFVCIILDSSVCSNIFSHYDKPVQSNCNKIKKYLIIHLNSIYALLRDEENPRLAIFERRLPCCGCGIGWSL